MSTLLNFFNLIFQINPFYKMILLRMTKDTVLLEVIVYPLDKTTALNSGAVL